MSFVLPESGPASLDVIDVAGRIVRTMNVGSMGPGNHVADLAPAGGLAPGVHFVRLRMGLQEARARAVILR